MTDALARIGERVLATCRSLTTVPLEVRFPGAALDVTADPALLVAQTWSAVLPAPPAREPYPQTAFPASEFGDGGFGQRDGGDRSPASAFPNRIDGDDDAEAGRRGLRRVAAAGPPPGSGARAASAGAAAQRPSLAPDLSWWSDRPGVLDVPAAARSRIASRPLADALRPAGAGEDRRSRASSPPGPPQPAAGALAASTRIAAESPASGAAVRARPSVSLVRPVRPAAPSAGLSAAAASAEAAAARDAAARGRGSRASGTAPSGPSALRGTPTFGADAPAGARAYPAREPLAPPPAPARTEPGATRMVRGTAGLASVLGAHLTVPGQPPPAAAWPPAAAPRGAVPHAGSADGNAASDPAAAGQVSHAHAAGARAAELLDAGGADAIYDALESRLRGEFLRTYGSYGS